MGTDWWRRGGVIIAAVLVSRAAEKNGKIFAGVTTVHGVTGRRIPAETILSTDTYILER